MANLNFLVLQKYLSETAPIDNRLWRTASPHRQLASSKATRPAHDHLDNSPANTGRIKVDRSADGVTLVKTESAQSESNSKTESEQAVSVGKAQDYSWRIEPE